MSFSHFAIRNLRLQDSKMAADVPHSGPPHRVCIITAYEIRYWAEKFDISPERLKAVIKRVGSSLTAVEQELGGR
jgi:hypothetical protein